MIQKTSIFAFSLGSSNPALLPKGGKSVSIHMQPNNFQPNYPSLGILDPKTYGGKTDSSALKNMGKQTYNL